MVYGLPGIIGTGEQFDLAFESFLAMTGQLVWIDGGEAGIALPEASHELLDRKAA